MISHLLLPRPSQDEMVVNYRAQFLAVRHHVFVERTGWEISDIDRYDEVCDSFVAVKDHEVVKGCRLIRRIAGTLPVQEYLPADFPIDPTGIEISRLASQGGMCNGFYGSLLEHLIRVGCETVYMTIREALLYVFEARGPKCFEHLPGTPMERHGKDGRVDRFFPAALSVVGMREILRFLERLESV